MNLTNKKGERLEHKPAGLYSEVCSEKRGTSWTWESITESLLLPFNVEP